MFFEHGDKAGKLLAHQAQSASASRWTPSIRSPMGELVTEPAGINLLFLDYYNRLYTSENPQNNAGDLDLLNSFGYPTIDVNIAKNLGDPITEQEVQVAITTMQSGKSPAPDGFTVEFYKAFTPILVPILVKLYNDSFKAGHLPPTRSEASISLLLKKDKDPTSCSSYRPISLYNVDFKILAKVLCLSLERVLPTLIAHDQTSFTPGRHSFFIPGGFSTFSFLLHLTHLKLLGP